jgi:hypothetical protein
MMFNQLGNYKHIKDHFEKIRDKHLSQLFNEDPDRAEKFSVRTKHVYFD